MAAADWVRETDDPGKRNPEPQQVFGAALGLLLVAIAFYVGWQGPEAVTQRLATAVPGLTEQMRWSEVQSWLGRLLAPSSETSEGTGQ